MQNEKILSVEAMREAAAKVVDDHGETWGLAYRSMTDALSNAIRSLPAQKASPSRADPARAIEIARQMDAEDGGYPSQEVEPAAEALFPAAIRERVAGVIETCLERHGVDLEECEGTIDDADEIIAFLSTQAANPTGAGEG